jgi:phage terminase large subunit-like protein
MDELDRFASFCSTLTLDVGGRMTLEPFQRMILADYFTGCRETLVLLSKKNGKSTLIAALAIWHLLTTPDAEVVVVAGSRDQADLILHQARGFIRRSRALGQRCEVHLREIRATAGARARVLAADVDTADGVLPTLALCDELHRWKNAELFGVLRDGLGPRSGRLVTISTAGEDPHGDPDNPKANPLAQLRTAALALPLSAPVPEWDYRTARSPSGDFSFHEWILADGRDSTIAADVKRANPASWQTTEELQRRISSPSMLDWQRERFMAGRWVAGEHSAIPADAWHACARSGLLIPRGSSVWVGLDMGSVRDTSAIVPVWIPSVGPGEPLRVVTAGAVIIRPPGGGRLAEVRDIIPTLRAMGELWTVQLAFDHNAGGGLVAQALVDEGIADAYLLAQDGPVMPAAAELLRHLVVERRLEHDGDPGVTTHVLNAVEQPAGPGKWRLRKPSESRHIDACVALAMAAYMAVQDAQTVVEQPFFEIL